MGYFKDTYPSDKEGESTSSRYLKSGEFEGEGLELQFVGMESVTANHPDYGANEADWLYKENKLQLGETFKYSFHNGTEEKVYGTKSAGFFIAMRQADPALGDKLNISKSGENRNTRYAIKVIK